MGPTKSLTNLVPGFPEVQGCHDTLTKRSSLLRRLPASVSCGPGDCFLLRESTALETKATAVSGVAVGVFGGRV